MQAPTTRQREVWECIKRLTRTMGYPPTRKEVATELRVSQQAIDGNVNGLVAKGWLQTTKGRARSLRVCVPDEIPLIRLDTECTTNETMPGRCADAFEPRADYFAEASDDTMSELGIMRGDLLAVQAATAASTGDVIIAALAKTRTCRRLERLEGGMVRLAPMPREAEGAVRPIMLDEAVLVIEGIVIGVLTARPLPNRTGQGD